MKKLGVVTPWYGENIPGGAESELRGLVKHMSTSGIAVEVLTTCVKEFNSHWNINYHKKGVTVEGGITVHRFKVRKHDLTNFHMVNYKLMNHILVSPEEETVFMEDMINSPSLYEYIRDNKNNYHAFLFMPYMFGTTYYGCKECLEKAILIPCFHEESYVYMDIFKNVFSSVKGIVYLSNPEYELANSVFNLSGVKQEIIGGGLETNVNGDGNRFRTRFGIREPFILYAGRKDKGKNIDLLINYFVQFKKRNCTDLKLVLLGGGEIKIPLSMREDIIDLGFVESQVKYDAYAAALLLCQPSLNESFSLVLMESWLCGRPVLVNELCKVTCEFTRETAGGLYFRDYLDFEGCIFYVMNHPESAEQMGINGNKYVKENFAWEIVIDKYKKFLEL